MNDGLTSPLESLGGSEEGTTAMDAGTGTVAGEGTGGIFLVGAEELAAELLRLVDGGRCVDVLSPVGEAGDTGEGGCWKNANEGNSFEGEVAIGTVGLDFCVSVLWRYPGPGGFACLGGGAGGFSWTRAEESSFFSFIFTPSLLGRGFRVSPVVVALTSTSVGSAIINPNPLGTSLGPDALSLGGCER